MVLLNVRLTLPSSASVAPGLTIILPAPDNVPPAHVKVLPTLTSPAPVSEPLSVRAALNCDGCDSARLAVMFIAWLVTMLRALAFVLIRTGPVVGPLMVTSLLAPGTVLPIQLAGSFHEKPSPAPVQMPAGWAIAVESE